MALREPGKRARRTAEREPSAPMRSGAVILCWGLLGVVKVAVTPLGEWWKSWRVWDHWLS